MSDRPKYSFWRKLGIFVFGFFFGIFALVGSVAGAGYWAYKNFNLQMLQGFGVNFGNVIDDESPLMTMTIEQLIKELTGIATGAGDSSINDIQTKYKLNLTDKITFLPPAALEVPIMKLLSAEGIQYILDNTNGNWALELLGKDKMPAFVQKILGDKPLSSLTSGDMNKLFAGVYVGDIMGFKMGEAQTAAATATDTSTKYDWTDANGAKISAMMNVVANIAVADLLGGSFDISTSLGGLYAGDIMDYTKDGIKDGSTVAAPKYNWKDKEGLALSAVNEMIANVRFNELMGGAFDFNTVVGDLYVGEVMGYTKNGALTDETGAVIPGKFNWTNKNQESVVGIENSVANVMMGELVGGNFQFASAFNGQYVGEILKYERGTALPSAPDAPAGAKPKYEWYKPDASAPGGKTRVTGMNEVIANIDMGQLLDGTFDAGETMSSIKLGDVIVFDDTTPAIFKALGAETKVGELSGKINHVLIGDVMDLHRKQIGTEQNPVWETDADGNFIWYNKDNTVAVGVMTKFAGLNVQELGNSAMVQGCINSMTLSDILVIDGNSAALLKAMKDTKIEDFGTRINTLAVGEIMDLHRKQIGTNPNGDPIWEQDGGKDVWYDKSDAKATGITAAFADLTMTKLADPTQIKASVDNLMIDEIMDLGTNPTGLMAQLKGTKVGDLAAKINGMKFGAVMGLEYKEGIWYEAGTTTAATGIAAAFADLSVSGMSSADFENSVNKLKIQDIFKAPTDGSTNIMSLVPANTAISDLPAAMANAITNGNMGALANAGIFDAAMQTNFSKISTVLYSSDANAWKTKTLTQFFTDVASVLSRIP